LRWPVLLPAIIVIKMFGTTRDTLLLPGLAAFAALLLLHFSATRRAFGIEVATLAGLALVTTPELLIAATRLTADLPEALFWSAALWSLWFAGDSRTPRRWMLAAGAAAALAWTTRETALGLIALFALAFACRWRGIDRRAYGWAALGFVGVALPEMILLARASGDWLYRAHTDLAHIHVASTNLAGSIDAATRVIADPELMARWRGSGPVRLHWAIDPWINLFAHPGYGLGFVAAAGTAAAAWRAAPAATRRVTLQIALAVAVQVAFVTYIIATDPKPRMLLPSVVLASLAFALAANVVRQSTGGRTVTALLLAAKLALTFVMIDLATSFADVPRDAAIAVAATSGPVEADRWTASELALAPQVAARLSDMPAAEALAIGKPGDHDGGGLPPPGRWTIVWRSPPGREPLVARALFKLGLQSESPLARDIAVRTPVVTLYRRD
jgi:4-amino-4-deoxy-L-arabinose transferase-like glycosyltransferase